MRPATLTATKIVPQDPLNAECTFGALMNEAHMNKVLGYIKSAKADGAKLIYGGEQVLKETGGFYVKPAIFDQVDAQNRIAQEEIFGPVLSIICFKDEAEAVEIANGTCFGLAAYVATQNVGRVQRMGDELAAGLIYMVAMGTPSGGNVSITIEAHKQSGFGFEAGIAGLAAYTAVSTVMCFT